MIEVYASIAVALIIAGAAIGILIVISVGAHHEMRANSFTTGSPSRIASGARALNGHYVRRPGVTAQQTSQHRQNIAA